MPLPVQLPLLLLLLHVCDCCHCSCCLQLQRAKAELGPSMLPGPGDTFTFSNMKREGTWEAQVYDAVPALSHMPVALQAFLQAGTAPEAVQIQKTLGLLRYEGVADVIHIHPAFYNRTKACLVPDSVAFNAWGKDREERDVQDTWYGQVSRYMVLLAGK